MKRYLIAAGTLLLSTSALAVAADTKDMTTADTDAVKVSAEAKAFDADWDKAQLASKAEVDSPHEPKFETASTEPTGDKLAWSGTGAKFDTASSATFDKPLATEIAAKTELASAESFDKPLATEIAAKTELASAESFDKPLSADASSKVQTASADTFGKPLAEHSGMGGPLEVAPQPAPMNYPPCSPGPGDDRCIQLYEPGVRTQLASWNRPTGGLLDGDNATAMGGPYEPVADTSGKPAEANLASVYKPEIDGAMGGPFEPVGEDEAKPAQAQLASVYKAGSDVAVGGPYEPGEDEIAMNGDGSVDTQFGETVDPAGDAQVTGHSEFTGVGGPVEAQSGYPPCSPGPGADRCIQLYEAGVTGAGN